MQEGAGSTASVAWAAAWLGSLDGEVLVTRLGRLNAGFFLTGQQIRASTEPGTQAVHSVVVAKAGQHEKCKKQKMVAVIFINITITTTTTVILIIIFIIIIVIIIVVIIIIFVITVIIIIIIIIIRVITIISTIIIIIIIVIIIIITIITIIIIIIIIIIMAIINLMIISIIATNIIIHIKIADELCADGSVRLFAEDASLLLRFQVLSLQLGRVGGAEPTLLATATGGTVAREEGELFDAAHLWEFEVSKQRLATACDDRSAAIFDFSGRRMLVATAGNCLHARLFDGFGQLLRVFAGQGSCVEVR
ncbi:hypothetical protein AK812_SmicGene13498 [Symbiodinium microadriaticum]|uniref:Uncharacterized protein n=1 Tax=Symbiodinium microadriaticum TaxID=2951 RepID=A0A1Q9E821_SYMMI|nr:hypothetical protein AK812_SmicGene13498 [Symbiodinium microadriaticum]